MKNTAIAIALLTAGYLAGSAMPHASALDSGAGIVAELRGIRQELGNIRRAVEKGAGK